MDRPALHTVDHARATTRRYARTFYFASHVLPPAKRDAAYVVYAFCRYADNCTDVHREDTDQRPDAERQIAHLREELNTIYAPAELPTRWVALRETIRAYGIPRAYLDDLLTGVAMDLTPRRFETWAELQVYCYRVASVVGLIMSHIFGATSPAALTHAAGLGTAMQLTNILRDVGEDHRMGRVYLPQEELRAYGITEDMIRAGVVTPAVEAFLTFQIARARALYADADRGIPMIPDDGSRFSTRLMSSLYSRILNAIERNGYDVFTARAHVPLRTKLHIATRLLGRSLTERSLPSVHRTDGHGDRGVADARSHGRHSGGRSFHIHGEPFMAMPLRPSVFEESFPVLIDQILQDAVARVEPATLSEILAEAVLGGKRIRPLLAALACEAAGGEGRDAATAGAALELLHVSSLVHDDIMDSAETRRGKPTVVAKHGAPVAILAGDALVALSFRMIQSLQHPWKEEIQQVLTSAFLSLCEGQCADVCNSPGVQGEPCTHTWMVERKTARLLEACTRIGGLVAGAPDHHVQALGSYGLSIGLAYQASDDLLDAIGSEQDTGKSTGLDARNGRTTFLSLAYTEHDRIEEIRKVIAEYTRDACDALAILPPSPARSRMHELAQGLLARRS